MFVRIRNLRILLFLLFVFAELLVLVPQTCAQANRPFTFEDMMALKRVHGPAVSPDNRWVTFSAEEVNLDANTKVPHIWIVPLGGGDARQLTSGASEDRPRWSPDAKHVAFISSRDGTSQVWVYDFDSATGQFVGEPRKITSISTEADGELWSPDGKNIIFTSSVYPDCPDDACNKAREQEKANSKVQARTFTHLMYRHWKSYTGEKRTHIFVVSAEGGIARDLTPGNHDAPPFTLGGQDMYAISPDGQELAFTSNIDEVEATSTNNDLFIVPLTGGKPRKITTNPASDSTPLYSPDGKYIAYVAQFRPGYESDRFRLMLYERKAGKITNLTEKFDRWVTSFAWASDSSRLYIAAEDKGEQPIYTVDLNGVVNPLITPAPGTIPAGMGAPKIGDALRGFNDDLAMARNGNVLVFTHMTVRAPNEIYYATTRDLRPECSNYGTPPIVPPNPPCHIETGPLTRLNDAVLSKVEMPALEPFWFKGAEKTPVEGFLIKPPGFSASQKYPVKFLIHGGPQGAWGDDWSYRWNAELFAANGYVVVMINPRGSTGYGQKFIDQINGDWGGKPFIDLMEGLDYVERTYPFVDKDRVCGLGASYGGYMVNWILGHTDRFKCLVSHDGMFNTESAYGTTEELWFPEWEFKGTPWTNRELYRKWSPHLSAAKFKTPTLVIHGQLDYRLDVSEGFQLFTTLQRQKIASKMLYFPDEGHWVMKPQNSRLWYHTVNDWVDGYLKTK